MLSKVDLLVAERDRLIREAAGSRRQVAEAAGLSPSQIQRIHSQRQIAQAAGISKTSVGEIINREEG